jgi:hypothetical protein
MNVHVEPHTVPREQPLCELAEDSATQLDSYLTAGRVLVALRGTQAIGHLQLVATDRPGELEIKNMAVREDHQGRAPGGISAASPARTSLMRSSRRSPRTGQLSRSSWPTSVIRRSAPCSPVATTS